MKNRLPRAAIDAVPRSVRRLVLRHVLPYSISQRLQTRRGADARRWSYTGNALKLEKKLWGGFSEQALRDLEVIKIHPRSSANDVSDAALALGCWHASRGNFDEAYQNAALARLAHPPAAGDLKRILLEAQALMALGEPLLAREILSSSLESDPHNPHLRLCLANTYATSEGPGTESDEAKRLSIVNQLFEERGVAPLAKRDPERPLVLDNLHAPTAVAKIPPKQQPKVTILIPAYSCVDTLHIAMDSLLGQTWENIEIIVIDDRSPDGTFDLAREYAARDPRVVALQVEENGGAYAARNFGLRHASGAFVTVHDADDWSHPQKIELQVRHLLDHPAFPANITDWVRCYEHLYFTGPTRYSQHWVITNASAFMLRIEVLREARGWDEVRIAADNELIRRVAHSMGRKIPKVVPELPLAFALDRPGSLTRQSRTHVNTIRHGVRRNYHDASRFWLSKLEPGLHAIHGPGEERAFPAPGFILKNRVEPSFDLLLIMDLYRPTEHFVSTMNYVEAALGLGLRVGVFHWPRYDLRERRRMRPEIRDFVHDRRVYLVSPGERLEADTVVVFHPMLLRHGIDLPPKISCRHFAIVSDAALGRRRGQVDEDYDPRRISDRMAKLFHKRPLWIPANEQIRRLMERDGRYERMHSENWGPLIDWTYWGQMEPRFRGAERAEPHVGRYGRDHHTKWPATADFIRSAFLVGRPCRVELLGGANVPTSILNGTPKNWKVLPAGAVEPREFLRNLDFFVHYPHEDYSGSLAYPVIEALASGVPVILPPVFESTFETAALYATPAEVWSRIESLWADERAWRARSEAGRQFVRERCDWPQLGPRLSVLAGFDDSV